MTRMAEARETAIRSLYAALAARGPAGALRPTKVLRWSRVVPPTTPRGRGLDAPRSPPVFAEPGAPPLSRPRRADVGVRIPGVATERVLACESTKLWEQRQWNLAAAMVPHVRRKPITAGGTCRWLAPGTPVQYTGGHCKKLAEIEVDGKLLCISLLQVGGIRCDEAGKQLCQPQPQASRLPDSILRGMW